MTWAGRRVNSHDLFAGIYQTIILRPFLALVVYAFVTSVTPGPNNFMLLASGVVSALRSIPYGRHQCRVSHTGACRRLRAGAPC